MNKQFAVLGLGSFGRSVALSLEKMGCDVMVVDDSYEKIQEISDKVSYAMKADVTDKDALQALGARNLDGAVVAVLPSGGCVGILRASKSQYYGNTSLQRDGDSTGCCKGER